MSPSACVDVTDSDSQGRLYESHVTDGKLRLGGTARGTGLSQRAQSPQPGLLLCSLEGQPLEGRGGTEGNTAGGQAPRLAPSAEVPGTARFPYSSARMSQPLAKRPPHPGLRLGYNELHASVPAIPVATCAPCKQLAGGRQAVGLRGRSFLH